MAQCDVVFYRDSLRQILTGYNPDYITRIDNYAVDKETVDSAGVKFIYRVNPSEPYDTLLAYRILPNGEVYYGSVPNYPRYRLCDTVGSMWISNRGNNIISYMMYAGTSLIEVLGTYRVSRVFRYFNANESSPDSLRPSGFDYHVVDSFGMVAEIDPNHSWANGNIVQGIWFGNEFVGVKPTDVEEHDSTFIPTRIELVDDVLKFEMASGFERLFPLRLSLYDVRGQVAYSVEISTLRHNAQILSGSHVQGAPLFWIITSNEGSVSRGIVIGR